MIIDETSMTPEELKEADCKERKESMTPFSPADAEGTFGLPVQQHQNTLVLPYFNLTENMGLWHHVKCGITVYVDYLNWDNTREFQ